MTVALEVERYSLEPDSREASFHKANDYLDDAVEKSLEDFESVLAPIYEDKRHIKVMYLL